MNGSFRRIGRLCLLAAVLWAAGSTAGAAGLDFDHVAALRGVREAAVSPDGALVAYTVDVPRRPGVDDDGPAWRELHLVAAGGGPARIYVGGEVKASNVRFSPAGDHITYLAKREDDEQTALWAIPVHGGESVRLLGFDTKIEDYRLSPDGAKIAFVAAEPKSEARQDAEDRGFSEEVFEEDWLPRRAWIAPTPPLAPVIRDPAAPEAEIDEPRALELEGSVFHVRWSPDSRRLAVDVAPRPLIDDRFMFRKIHVVDAATGAVQAKLDNPGKLGAFEISPDGATVAMISAADPNDPAEGRLMVAPTGGGALRDVLPALDAHVVDFAWRDGGTLLAVLHQGVESRLQEIELESGQQRTLFESGQAVGGLRVPVISAVSAPADGGVVAVVGSTPSHPAEVFAVDLDRPALNRLSDNNPWLDELTLHPQEVFVWRARDGLELEGLLISPTNASEMGPLPLIMVVHGGPEAHRSNNWLTRYSSPGQLAADRGYAVFYPNYRGSAGAEFDDLVDAVAALVDRGIVDADRVGVTGGSYGGYATAWLATRHSEHFRAGVMFVGISNKLSKGMTTEIPLEDIMVHTRFPPYTKWQFSLERSPIYWVEQARTPLLIAAGTDDSRVHPSQSLQLYRALKLVGETPVRYVRYPGEGHGNARAAARDDYARRLMRWMDHFVKEKGSGLPPWEIER
jgi:dipeptidyl aminopeptidase/acylaminoacyl peptidase